MEDKDRLDRADKALSAGNYETAYELLAPLLGKKHPAAFYLYSHFSFSDKESVDEFAR